MINKDKIDWKGRKELFTFNNYSNMKQGERARFNKLHSLQFRDEPTCTVCNHVYFNCICDDEIAKGILRVRKAEMKKPFEEKLKYSRDFVEKVLKELKGKRIFLAYSGGFDSECCLQLFKESVIDSRVKVIFGDTLMNYPASYDRINAVEKELGIKILRAKPAKGVSFRKIVSEHGLPLYSRGSSSDSKHAQATKKCCEYLKKRPMRLATKGIDATILGLKASENQYRRFSILRFGDFHKTKISGYRILPIAYWNLKDEWKFQKLECFNYNRLYDMKFKLADGREYKPRTGCWCCPQPSYAPGHLCWLKRYYPKQHKILVEDFGLRKYLKVYKIKGREYWVRTEVGEKSNYISCEEIGKRFEEIFFGSD